MGFFEHSSVSGMKTRLVFGSNGAHGLPFPLLFIEHMSIVVIRMIVNERCQADSTMSIFRSY